MGVGIVRRAAALGVAIVAISASGAATPVPAQALPAALPATLAPATLELTGIEQLTPRLQELIVHSPALQRETVVRVLTPAGFDPARDHLPVLWLLHGGNGSFRDWTTTGDAEALTAGLPLIVVMPDAGGGGWYSDWAEPETIQGVQAWETYHVGELLPFVHQRFQTRTDRAGNAIVGLSMGGFGAMHHAARHPDLYGFAAAFSGAVDILHPGVGLVTDLSPFVMDGLPGDIWGDRVSAETNWRANNPVDLAANLRTVETQLRTGNGQPGGTYGNGFDPLEAGVSQATASLHQRLDSLGIGHLYLDYGPGGHLWAHWRDDLVATLPRLLEVAATAAPAPTTVEHLAFEPSYSVWGFDVALARSVLESSVLTVAPGGFALQGSGAGVVTTPPDYEPGEIVRAASPGSDFTLELAAGLDGRVAVPVDLGPAGSVDEYPAGALVPPRQSVVEVTLERLAAGELASGPGDSIGADTAGDSAVAARAGAGGGALPATGAPSAPFAAALLLLALAATVHRLGRLADR